MPRSESILSDDMDDNIEEFALSPQGRDKSAAKSAKKTSANSAVPAQPRRAEEMKEPKKENLNLKEPEKFESAGKQ